MIGSAKLLFGLAASSIWLLGVASGSTITVGLPAGSGGVSSCDPFGCPTALGLTTYQQVYSAASFSGPLDISEIEFFDTEAFNGTVSLAGGTYTLDLSLTSQAVGDLDSTSPANNIGSGNQVFFTGSLPSVNNEEVLLNGTPFFYNPADGNLLLTVTISGAFDRSGNPVFLDSSSSGTATTYAAFTSFFGTIESDGLVTGFIGASAPEPATVVLAGVPLGLLYLARRRRSKRDPA